MIIPQGLMVRNHQTESIFVQSTTINFEQGLYWQSCSFLRLLFRRKKEITIHYPLGLMILNHQPKNIIQAKRKVIIDQSTLGDE